MYIHIAMMIMAYFIYMSLSMVHTRSTSSTKFPFLQNICKRIVLIDAQEGLSSLSVIGSGHCNGIA